MYKNYSIAVVIPAYNEEAFIGDVIEGLPDYVDRIYPVDDCSTDGTWEEIQRAAGRVNERSAEMKADGGQLLSSTKVVPIRHEENQGVGGAMKTGYRRAREDGLDVAASLDGDGQMDPSILDTFLDPIVDQGADYVKGNRLLDWEYLGSMPRWRLFGNVLLSGLTKIASGYWKMMDPQNGYTAVRLDVFDEIPIDSLYDDYGFENDILIVLNAHDKVVADVSMAAMYGDEVSDIRYGKFIREVSMLLLWRFLWRLNIKYLVRDFHPLALFYYAGAGMVGLGGLGLLATLALFLSGGGAAATVGVGSLLTALLGVLSLLHAMYLDMQEGRDLELRF